MGQNILYSDFYCIKCANKICLPRKKSKQREHSHLKKIYCVKCKEEINHYEVREFDHDFVLEDFLEQIKIKGDASIEEVFQIQPRNISIRSNSHSKWH